MTKECKQQFTLRISQANATQLVVILYEMCLVYLDEADCSLQKNDNARFREDIRKVRGCIAELLQSLNLDYEPAPALLQLYLFCLKRLVHAQLHKDPKGLEDIKRIMMPLKEAYANIQDQNTSGPVMDNAQTVYAGLTYGRNSLTENTSDPGNNRGMLV